MVKSQYRLHISWDSSIIQPYNIFSLLALSARRLLEYPWKRRDATLAFFQIKVEKNFMLKRTEKNKKNLPPTYSLRNFFFRKKLLSQKFFQKAGKNCKIFEIFTGLLKNFLRDRFQKIRREQVGSKLFWFSPCV